MSRFWRYNVAGLAWWGVVFSGLPAVPADDLQEVLEAQAARVAIVEEISQPTLAVFGPDGGGGGSGVVISPDGYALTNYHVVKPCGDYMLCGMSDGKLYDAVVVGIDPTGDVALIKLLGREDFPVAKLGDSDQLQAGDWCYVVGNPFLLATDFRPTVTFGIVSGTHRYQYPAGTLLEYADCIQTDAAINPGNSGGPLFNAAGELVGINGRGSFEKRGRVNVGVGYAISINQIKKFYGYLRSGRIVDHARLGATVSTNDLGQVIVTDIRQSSDAYRRGLRYEDEIVALGGKPVSSANEFKNILGTFPKGWRIPLAFRQDGIRQNVLVRLDGVHSREQLITQVQSKPIQMPGGLPDKKPKRIPDIEPQPEPQRDGNSDPNEDSDPEEIDKSPRKPPRRPRLPLENKPEEAVPAHIAKLIEARRGYANYYFNRLHVERIWNQITAHGDLSGENGEWILSGTWNGGQRCEFILRDDEAFVDLPQGQFRVDLSGDLDAELSPAGSGGLLLSMAMWRRLLVMGPIEFGEVYYLGTAPYGEQRQMLDVVVATYGSIESHFAFEPTSGELLRIEMYPALHTDPCELLFTETYEENGRVWPKGIKVRVGPDEFGFFQLDGVVIKPRVSGSEL